MDHQSRRRFLQGSLALAGLGLLSGCGLLPTGNTPGRVAHIGFLTGTGRSATAEAFRAGLQDLGYVEGQNIAIEWRFADGQLDRLPDLAAELVALQPEAIVVGSDAAANALIQRTKTIPLVTTSVGDPVGNGWIASLAHPGGNVTGLTNISSQLTAKWPEILKGAVPGLARVAVVGNPTIATHITLWRGVDGAAAALGLEVVRLEMQRAEDYETVFEAAGREHVGGLVLLPEPVQNVPQNRSRFLGLAAQYRLPAIYAFRETAEAGGLLAYGVNNPDLYRRAATYVDKILKGANPAELPVEQPTRFDFVINLKTAQDLGLTIPQEVLIQATEAVQ